MAASILVLAPLVYLYSKLCRSRLTLQRAAASGFDFKRPNLLMKLWGAALLGLVGSGAFLKFTKKELISHPAYLWQPCHVHSLVMGLCAFVETEGSLLAMHVATTLWWGPFLAFVAPSLPTDPLEVGDGWMEWMRDGSWMGDAWKCPSCGGNGGGKASFSHRPSLRLVWLFVGECEYRTAPHRRQSTSSYAFMLSVRWGLPEDLLMPVTCNWHWRWRRR